MAQDHPRSSRQRYRRFLEDYKHRRLDDSTDGADGRKQLEDPANVSDDGAVAGPRRPPRGKRREYLREYLRWLRPHRYGLAAVLLLALLAAGLQMIEPLFMRFVVDRVAQFRKTAFPTAAVYGPTVAPTLRLITCAGPYHGHYRDNLVVFAHLKS